MITKAPGKLKFNLIHLVIRFTEALLILNLAQINFHTLLEISDIRASDVID